MLGGVVSTTNTEALQDAESPAGSVTVNVTLQLALQVEDTTSDAAAEEPEFYENYTFEQWLGFLSDSRLVLSQDERVAITLAGREFLKFILHQGYSLYKQG